LKKQTIQNEVQDIEAGEIAGLQTLFATALLWDIWLAAQFFVCI